MMPAPRLFKALIRLHIIPVPPTRFKPIISARRCGGPAGQGRKPLHHYENHYAKKTACNGFSAAKSTGCENHYATTAKTAPLRARVQARARLCAHARACGAALYCRSGVVVFPYFLENKGKSSGFCRYAATTFSPRATTSPRKACGFPRNCLKSFKKVGN